MNPYKSKSQLERVQYTVNQRGYKKLQHTRINLAVLEGLFRRPDGNRPIERKNIEVDGLSEVSKKKDIAIQLAYLISQYPSICSIEWNEGKDFVKVELMKGFQQVMPEGQEEVERLASIIQTALFSRFRPVRLQWNLHQSYMSLDYYHRR